jgi:hypothetical protein
MCVNNNNNVIRKIYWCEDASLMDTDVALQHSENSPMFRRNMLPLSSRYKCWPFYRESEGSRLLRNVVKFILDCTAPRTRRRSHILPAWQNGGAENGL